MANTARTQAEILALIPDNSSGAISPQDLRDLYVSIAYGAIYVTGGAAAQASIGTSPVVMTGWAADAAASANVTPAHGSDNITLAVAGVYAIFCQVSFSGTNSATFTFQARVGASDCAGASCKRKLGTGGDVGSASFLGLATATAGQAVDVTVVAAAGAANSMTPTEAALVAIRLK